MPWPASPPSTFCQEKVTTSSLPKSSALREGGRGGVADRQPLPVGGDPIGVRNAHARGGAVPGEDHVPGPGIDRGEVGQLAIGGLDDPRVLELELFRDVGHPAFAEAFPGQHVDRARRRASTTGPSRRRRCRTPARCRCGSRPGPRSTSRVRSIARFRRALPIFARCERPSASSLGVAGSSRGAWRRGRTRKTARAGARRASWPCRSILPDGRPSVGRGLPPPLMWELAAGGQARVIGVSRDPKK